MQYGLTVYDIEIVFKELLEVQKENVELAAKIRKFTEMLNKVKNLLKESKVNEACEELLKFDFNAIPIPEDYERYELPDLNEVDDVEELYDNICFTVGEEQKRNDELSFKYKLAEKILENLKQKVSKVPVELLVDDVEIFEMALL